MWLALAMPFPLLQKPRQTMEAVSLGEPFFPRPTFHYVMWGRLKPVDPDCGHPDAASQRPWRVPNGPQQRVTESGCCRADGVLTSPGTPFWKHLLHQASLEVSEAFSLNTLLEVSNRVVGIYSPHAGPQAGALPAPLPAWRPQMRGWDSSSRLPPGPSPAAAACTAFPSAPRQWGPLSRNPALGTEDAILAS